MISVVCAYNKPHIFKSVLCKSLKNQNIDVEIIAVDNSKNRFSSASSALNYGAQHANGDILLFVHQDIIFKENDAIKNIATAINKLPVGTVVGIAGAIEKNKKNLGNYTSGLEYNPNYVYSINKLTEVSTVDELLCGMKRETFDLHNFDSKICNGWHLYAVEMCLYHRSKGGHVFVLPIQFHHLSNGRINREYMRNFINLAKKYKPYNKYIWTTCYKLNTNTIMLRVIYFAWLMKRFITGNLE